MKLTPLHKDSEIFFEEQDFMYVVEVSNESKNYLSQTRYYINEFFDDIICSTNDVRKETMEIVKKTIHKFPLYVCFNTKGHLVRIIKLDNSTMSGFNYTDSVEWDCIIKSKHHIEQFKKLVVDNVKNLKVLNFNANMTYKADFPDKLCNYYKYFSLKEVLCWLKEENVKFNVLNVYGGSPFSLEDFKDFGIKEINMIKPNSYKFQYHIPLNKEFKLIETLEIIRGIPEIFVNKEDFPDSIKMVVDLNGKATYYKNKIDVKKILSKFSFKI